MLLACQLTLFELSFATADHVVLFTNILPPPRLTMSMQEPYTEKNHRDWCDEYNKGITNYGVHPDYLPRDLIRFDIFICEVQLQKN